MISLIVPDICNVLDHMRISDQDEERFKKIKNSNSVSVFGPKPNT